ncbi:uncharacterized protein LOC121392319 [Gigantopelta aegis]|uniref:uncharacterized protein LOC121392319 n=1 Tax=Gigantopelta aegis TaxID=1735272 RepID=UPI001B889580|nr:uncharacterized protein LOC121392319 [Gigantopelta aegis]
MQSKTKIIPSGQNCGIMRTSAVLAVFLCIPAVTWSLTCVSCQNATCTPPLPGCELGRRVCSCCVECRMELGDACTSFTAECESELVCLTQAGAFIGRPPFSMNYLVGQCIKPRDIPHNRRAAPQNLHLV